MIAELPFVQALSPILVFYHHGSVVKQKKQSSKFKKFELRNVVMFDSFKYACSVGIIANYQNNW